MKALNSRHALWTLLALLAVGGCKNHQRDEDATQAGTQIGNPPPQATGGQATETAAPGTAAATATPDPDLVVISITSVDIDTKLAQLCGLRGSSVFFKFDSAKLQPEAKDRLQQIATCVTTGPAKGKDLRIVGRADPSGSDQYNQQLGMSRAEAVSRYLATLGVKQSRVDVESKGETGAIQDPFGWPLNRRVTIRLQEP